MFSHLVSIASTPTSFRPLSIFLMFFGVLFLLFGFLVLFVPELLRAIAAAFLFVLGLNLLFAGWRLRAIAGRKPHESDIEIMEY